MYRRAPGAPRQIAQHHRWVTRITLAGLIGVVLWTTSGTFVGQAAPRQPFDHDRTLFPLTGQHKRVECEACHRAGKYESLPSQCGACHQTPARHVVDQRAAASGGGCAACHDTTDWTRATFVHSPSMTAGLCSTCHNGRRAVGKPAGHIATTAECGTCHTTTSFAGAGYQHDGTVAGRCDTCHNGRTATGKPSGHLATTAQCDQCHNTRSFAGASFSHDPATTAGRCDTCHNGRTATGKPSGHLATTVQCDQCHRTTGWIPATYASHDNPRLIGGHSPLECRVCHPQSFTSVFYRDGVQFGFCSNCHRRDYDPVDHHRNVSLQVNANCANCHEHAGYRF